MDTNLSNQEYAMLKTIADVSVELLSFIEALQLSLSKPQKQHVAQVADALITTEGSKTGFVAGARSINGRRGRRNSENLSYLV